MIHEQLEEQAALYAAGALTAQERAPFELILEFHQDLRALVRQFEEITVSTTLGTQCNSLFPSPNLKARVLGLLDDRVQQTRETGFVMSGPDALVEWVNPAFTAMCGYTLAELRGKKLGPFLQGAQTDPAVAQRMRAAIAAQEPCTEALINYHKNGTPYWVSVNITPIKDSAGQLLWYVARELELTERQVS